MSQPYVFFIIFMLLRNLTKVTLSKYTILPICYIWKSSDFIFGAFHSFPYCADICSILRVLGLRFTRFRWLSYCLIDNQTTSPFSTIQAKASKFVLKGSKRPKMHICRGLFFLHTMFLTIYCYIWNKNYHGYFYKFIIAYKIFIFHLILVVRLTGSF